MMKKFPVAIFVKSMRQAQYKRQQGAEAVADRRLNGEAEGFRQQGATPNAPRSVDGEAERFWGKLLLEKRLSPKPPSRKLLSLRKMPISQSTFFAEAKTFLDRV
ncbi:hypothetical protein J7M00_07345 [bacterium]|nr:hypothetical protein [bacterium]